MNKLRIFYWGADRINLLKELCFNMYKQGILEICVCIPMTNEENIIWYDEEYFKVISSKSLDENSIDNITYKNIAPLEEDILLKMLPYESRAIELGMRRTNVPIVEYTREQQRYYRELRNILYLFHEYKINSYFAGAVPHYQDAYIGYALAKIYGYPVRFFVPCTIPFRRVIAKDISSIGLDIGEYYESIKNEKIEITKLSSDIEKYFDIQTLPMAELKKLKSPGNDKETKNIFKRHKRHYWGVWSWKHQIIWNPISRYVKRIWEIRKYKDDKQIWSRKKLFLHNFLEEHALVRFFMKYYKFTLNQYNKKAEQPDLNQKFIYFALQFVPEATTIPQGGVFSSQYLSIQLLAKCAETHGMYVYVKEHGHLAWRNRHFYDEISMIPNVKFIKSTVNTYDLVEKCIAVATQTGTCILEGVLQGKPALVFGGGDMWKKMPGVFPISSFEQGDNILQLIQSKDFKINAVDVKKYFYAIDQKTETYTTGNNVSDEELTHNYVVLENVFQELLNEL